MPPILVVQSLSNELERVILVPVIHTDTESIKKAREIVLEIRPDVVAVELDRTRYHQLQNPQSNDMPVPPSTGDSVMDLMNQIAMLEKSLGQMTGALAGAEMLAAIEAGREVNAKIALVDRPIEKTFQALMQVPLDEIYKLAEMIPDATEQVGDGNHGSIFAMLRDEDKVDELLEEFKKEFPALSNVLLDQRNIFIAKAIKSILSDVDGKVVVVLGAGHIEGVTRSLRKMIEADNAC